MKDRFKEIMDIALRLEAEAQHLPERFMSAVYDDNDNFERYEVNEDEIDACEDTDRLIDMLVVTLREIEAEQVLEALAQPVHSAMQKTG